jgi:hypothetical protein
LYDRHPSPRLIKAFKGYQGQDPQYAKFIFFGLDANFAEDIEEKPIFEEVVEYLNDGVTYWQMRKRHHPFLSGAYKKGSGYRYHHQFSKLGLTSEYADKVSFIELLDCPTCGNTSLKRLIELLKADYLRKVDNALSSANGKKSVYISRGVYSKLYNIGQTFGCFEWLPGPREFQRNTLYTILDRGNLKIHVITHFSDAISDEHLAEIRSTIRA